MAPNKKKQYWHYDESVLTEEDKNALKMYNNEIDKIYSRAHEKTLILKQEEKNKRAAENRKRKREIELREKQERNNKIQAFPERLEKIKKTYFDTIFNKNDTNLLKELKEFSQHCIHPEVFKTTTTVKEYLERGGGQGPDDYILRTVVACGLCRSKVHVSNFFDYMIDPGRFIDIVKINNDWRTNC